MSGDKRSETTRRPRAIKRPRVPAGPLRELKDLLYKLYLEADAPTMDAVAAAIAEDDGLLGAPSKDSVHRCLVSAELPPNQADVAAVAVVLARMAAWDPNDVRARARDLWVEARMTVPLGQLIAECDPITLEVHRAIEVSLVDNTAELQQLPTYVPRAHDQKLRKVVDRAAAGTTGIAILVGGSSTGKTRACWEAVQHLPAGWRLWHPINPSHPEAALEQLPTVGPRTVVWLNETQHYLDTSGESGEQVAARLRDVMRDPDRAPILVLGTMWPGHWDALTAAPSSGNAPNAHIQARKLLSGAAIRVPASFDETALGSLRTAAVCDARLRQAVEQAEQGRVAQYLAGGPALVERYETAPPAARALVNAAMDARRLGHGMDLPMTFLEGAAWAYLDEFERDQLGDDWVEQALAYTAAAVHGVRGLLTRCRKGLPGPDTTNLDFSTYRLADYVEQYGRLERHSLMPPEDFWNAAAEHVHTPDYLMNFANAAHIRWRKKLAAEFYGRVTTTHPKAFTKLISLLIEADKYEEVKRLAPTTGLGDSPSLTQIAVAYAEKGLEGKARGFALQAIEAGQLDTLEVVDRILASKKKRAIGASFDIPGDEGPHSRSVSRPHRTRSSPHDWLETPVWFFPASSGSAPWVLAEVAGRQHEAERLAEEAATAGATWAWLNVAAVRLEAGDKAEEVERLILLAADAGDLQALEWLAGRRTEVGNTAEANRLALLALNAGNPAAAMHLKLDEEGSHRTDLQLMRYGLTIEGKISGPW
ncbi:hypothetical protein ACFC0C_16365 [Streptomyces sp. NPDC056178]|uniref:hypothetical protein n=1 Tax=unclassified Streptomyces TaxID=2593676 RepID=UPI0035E362D9